MQYLLCHQRGSTAFHGIFKVPWNLAPTPDSMESHGIPTPSWEVPWNFMELLGVPCNPTCLEIHYPHLERSTEFHVIFFSNNDNMPLNYLKALSQGILNNFKKETEYLKDFTSMGHSVDCHGTLRTLQPGDPHFKRSQVSVDFHGIFHGIIEWVSRVARSNITKFHGIPWNQQDPISNDTMVPWNIPWNSMERWSRQIKCHQIPSNAMELGDRNFKWYQCSIGL